MKYCYIDFEFNETAEKDYRIYCYSYQLINTELKPEEQPKPVTVWIYKRDTCYADLRNKIELLHNTGFTFISWSVEAEARCFMSLGFSKPWEFRWYDLYLEYRMLVNHNHKIQYGDQLINGKVKKTYPAHLKKFTTKEVQRNMAFDKPSCSLAAATFKLLGVIRDTEHKDKMRDLIIEAKGDIEGSDREAILRYCEEDVVYLPRVFDRIREETTILVPAKHRATFREEILRRGEYAARTAAMVAEGYRINRTWVKSFSESTKDIIKQVQEEINENFLNILPFEYDKKSGFYVQKRKKIDAWIDQYCKDSGSFWARTETGMYEQSLEEWENHFSFKHVYPSNNFAAQMIRLGRINQSLNGFKPVKSNSDRRQFWEYLGKDGYVRPYMGIYGAQSARSQPSAISFIPLKAAWMRALIEPEKGYAYAGLDYKSQEFLIGAGNSGDKNMMSSYHSGDVYFHFAKLAKAVPMNAERKDYESVRDKFKSTTLAIQYLMGAESLAKKIILDTNQYCSVEEAQYLIDLFNETYYDFFQYREEIIEDYQVNGYLRLFDGWYMWGDNPNHRSVANVPVQGMGSVIMREAVALAQNAGLVIPWTLHDALYLKYRIGEESKIDELSYYMKQAFKTPYLGTSIESQMNVGIDVKVWSPEYPGEDGELVTPGGIKCLRQQVYVDKRAKEEYKKFEKYFYKNTILELI